MLAVLNDVAHAISCVVPVYALDSTSSPNVLAQTDLIDGKFDRGAMTFRTKDGRELKHLTVQRGDMRVAISVLKATNATFGRALPR